MASSKGLKARVKPKKKPVVLASPPSQWVVVQLTPLGEREKNIKLIERAVHQLLNRKDIEVFVPAINQKGQDDSLTTWFSEGYIFVRYEENVSYHKMAETNYFSSVLSTMNLTSGERKRQYSLLGDKDLSTMRNGMQELKTTGGHDKKFYKEQDVKIIKGNYKNLPGKITMIYDDGELVQVFVKLKSITGGGLFMDFPSSYLQRLDPI